MIKNSLACLLISLTFLTGCNMKSQKITDKTGAPVYQGTITDNQTGAHDSTLNYCYYLPKKYNGVDKFPVVFFLDPHAKGKLPLQHYAKLADEYGYIFIASNTIKNGLSAYEASRWMKELMNETKNRFTIDEKQLFASGFSGGAKLALIYTEQMPEIIGVIACGGSIPINKDQRPNYYYAGITGNQDFNYLETQQTATVFDQQGFDYTSINFDGGHEWPPVESFEIGLIGLKIYSIKIKRAGKNEDWLDKVWQRMNDSITHFAESKDLINENIYLSQTQRWFYGLKNIQDIKKKSIALTQNIDFRKHLQKKQKLIQNEVKLRAEFIRAIQLRNMDWWEREIANMNKSINQNDKDIAQVSQRLLNYLSMASFMLVKTDLDDARLDEALKKLKIYQLVDTDNPDVYLMYAHYFMQLEDYEAMNLNYKKAIDLGFADIESYKKDAFWTNLLNRKDLVN